MNLKRATKNFVLLSGFLAMAVGAARAATSTEKSPHAKVRLVTSNSPVKVGEPFSLGLAFDIDPEWHIYWKNPGDSGTALTADWKIPAGLRLLPQRWPVPHRLPVGPLANYGYEGNVLLPFGVDWRLTEDFAGDQIKIQVKADWLICRVECLPAEGEYSIEIPVDRENAELSADAHLFDKVKYAEESPGEVKLVDGAGEYRIEMTVPEGFDNSAIKWDFYSSDELRIQHAAIPTYTVKDKVLSLRVAKDVNAPTTVEALAGLVIATGRDASDRVAFEVNAARAVETAPAQPLWLLLAFAFLGGLILNVMPCVFPVLSLKILSFVHESSKDGAESKSAMRRHGWVFGLGVLVSFWALASLLLVLRQSGLSLGWGFQLQSPVFVSALVALFFVIGLNFMGFLEINFAGGKLGSAGAGRGGYVSSFLSGVLATVVATPCTAPFMGVALGAALALPPLLSLAIFTCLGLGMAAPYVILSHNPRWLSKLPRPGAWMETFRQFLAFPIFATSLWLLWVLTQQNPGEVISLLIVLLFIAFWIWIARVVEPKPRGRRWFWHLVAALLVFGTARDLVIALGASAQSTATAKDMDSVWQPYTPEAFDAALKSSPYVLIDFTASWCITCQVNKKVVLNTPAAQSFLKSRGVTALRADWTHQEAQITQHLESIGRSSVPTYVIYAKGRANFALLPEILTQEIFETQINQFIQQQSGGTK